MSCDTKCTYWSTYSASVGGGGSGGGCEKAVSMSHINTHAQYACNLIEFILWQ